MVKLTVLYNLHPDADMEQFLRWRLTEHQQDNAQREGVVHTDFYVAEDTVLGPPKYRFVTEAYYRTMEDLERDFLNDKAQEEIRAWIEEHRLVDFTAIVSTERASSNPDRFK